jgi:hypothetical protein
VIWFFLSVSWPGQAPPEQQAIPLSILSYHYYIGGMVGKRKRRRVLAKASCQIDLYFSNDICALCGRPLGRHIELHHLVPKSHGGTEMVPVHPICHRTIHAYVSNRELASVFVGLDALRAREDISRFLRWIGNKPPDFHAPTRRNRSV